ncbi:MAG TPA: hypothetical protein VIM00_07470, partial [Candidatus Acidoferrum sp.]
SLWHRVGPKSGNLALGANNFSSVFDRKSLGHRYYPSLAIVELNIRQSFTEADRTSEFRLTDHVSNICVFNMRRSFGPTGGTCDQPIGRNPCGVPGFEGLSTNFTLETVNFSRRRHAFGAAIDRSAFAGSVARF